MGAWVGIQAVIYLLLEAVVFPFANWVHFYLSHKTLRRLKGEEYLQVFFWFMIEMIQTTGRMEERESTLHLSVGAVSQLTLYPPHVWHCALSPRGGSGNVCKCLHATHCGKPLTYVIFYIFTVILCGRYIVTIS